MEKKLILSAGSRKDFIEMLASYYFSKPEKIQLLESGAVMNGAAVVGPRWEVARGRFRFVRVVEE